MHRSQNTTYTLGQFFEARCLDNIVVIGVSNAELLLCAVGKLPLYCRQDISDAALFDVKKEAFPAVEVLSSEYRLITHAGHVNLS